MSILNVSTVNASNLNMTTIQVSNVNFESTSNNQLVYAANTLTIRSGGANVIFSNTTTVATTGNLTVSNNITATGTVVMDSSFLRNRIINGNMYIAQRATSATVTAGTTVPTTSTGYPACDRWFVYSTGANVTAAQVAGSDSNKNLLRITGAASVTAVGIGQRIEQLNSYDLANTTCTLSVDISNSLLTTVTWTASRATTTANIFGTIGTPTKTQIATGTFTVTSTLTRYTASFAVPAAATTGIEILFTVGAQTSGTWQIGNVQFEPGSVATPFERTPFGTQLSLCQRHYWIQTPLSFAAYMVNTDTMYMSMTCPTTMFAAGTYTQSSFSTSTGATFTISAAGAACYFITLQNGSGAAGRVYAVSGTITASAEIP